MERRHPTALVGVGRLPLGAALHPSGFNEPTSALCFSAVVERDE